MISTRLTERLELRHPVIQAPMAFAAGGKLASAVSHAGGLGMIGGAYGDKEWLDIEFRNAGNSAIGCGFITWSLAKNPQLLTQTLDRNPKAVFLSFADPEPFSREITTSGAVFICQVQRLEYAKRAIDCGADIIVAQGTEAGGHGEKRATMTLVPEIADLVTNRSPETLVCAAGGIADGRGLAASLMLGADGVLVGSRFWASQEAIVGKNMIEAALNATGDDTVRSTVMDVARELEWPAEYTCRVLQNSFTKRWHHDLDGLIQNAKDEAKKWREAWAADNPDGSNTFVGEGAGLIHDVRPAGDILESIVNEAEDLLGSGQNFVT